MSALFRKFASKYYLQFGQVCRIHLRCQWPETASYKASASATAVPTDYCGNMIYETELLERAYVYTLPLMLIDATFIKMTNTVEPSIFHLYFRIYNPVERISNNEWTMPAIMRID